MKIASFAPILMHGSRWLVYLEASGRYFSRKISQIAVNIVLPDRVDTNGIVLGGSWKSWRIQQGKVGI